MDAVQWFAGDEPFEGFDAERELALSERPLSAEAAITEPFVGGRRPVYGHLVAELTE